MTVQYNAKSYMINGEQVFLNSAAVHYFRMPREEWREVLVKAKLAGMNCIDTYFAWNIHEPEEGEWCFEGDRDCGAFLDLCAELGLWVIARPGPYICAEWDFGGFPWWLSRIPEVVFRSFNKPYLAYVDRYFDTLIPLIRDRQLSRGGTVILVQVENEYGYLADDERAAAYMEYLRDGLLGRGIDVPLITCVGGVEGAVEGANFWSNADQHYEALTRKQPDTPKMVTEFWTGWFEHWGSQAATQKTARLYETRSLEILRAGYSGISHYMFYGGTNFAGYGGRTVGAGDIFMVTSYDYDAPLNEYGRVTAKYAVLKKLGYYIGAIQPLLLNAVEGDAGLVRVSDGFTARCRVHGNQRIWFVESGKAERETGSITLPAGDTLPVTVQPGGITPVLEEFAAAAGVLLTCNAYLLGNENLQGVHTMIIAADQGIRSWIKLKAEQQIRFAGRIPQLMTTSDEGRTVVLDSFHFAEPQCYEFIVGDQPFRLVLINGEGADQAWRIKDEQGVRWALGYTDLDLAADGTWQAAFGGNGAGVLHLGGFAAAAEQDHAALMPYVHLERPVLQAASASRLDLSAADRASAPGTPADFAATGRAFGHLLYTCDLKQGSEEQRMLILPKVQDSFRVYVNGEEQGLVRALGAAAITLRLTPNRTNRVQLLVQHMGRLNFSPYLGEFKGIQGPVFLDGTTADLREGWQHGPEILHLGQVCEAGPEAVLRRSFTIRGQDRAVLVGALSGQLKINGIPVEIPGYQNWFMFHTLDISGYILEGDNEIEMGYVKTPLDRLELIAYHSADELPGWTTQAVDGSTLRAGAGRQHAGPARYILRFARPQWPEAAHPKLKLRLSGMSKGQVKLNGIDLGRYWTIGPQEDYKIPLAWLQDSNELELFDEAGHDPADVKLLYDNQSSRRWIALGR